MAIECAMQRVRAAGFSSRLTLCCGARTFEISCCGRGFCPPEVRAELQRSTLHRTDERRPLGSSHQHVLSLLPCVQAPPSASPEGPVVTSESRAPARSGLDALLSRPPSLVSRVSLRPATLVSFTHQRPNSTCPVHHCFLQLQIFVSCEQFGRWFASLPLFRACWLAALR